MAKEPTPRQDRQNGERTTSDNDPLQSWKEIGAYLDRDVRTARRWEQAEGLPVRRHRSGSRSSVYAYPSELDAWRTARKPKADERPPARPLWRRPFPALAGSLVLLLAVWLIGPGPILNPPRLAG